MAEDPGTPPDRINQRILAKLAQRDQLANVEAAQRRIPTRLGSPEMKRLYLRFFDSFQFNIHYISILSRINLPEAQVAAVEKALLDRLSESTEAVDTAAAGAQALLVAQGITNPATYQGPTLDIQARVISRFGRRYLELITKVDELMPLLDTLCIEEVITQEELQRRKEQYKKLVRSMTGSARHYAGRLRRRVRYLASEEGKAEAAGEAAIAGPTGSPSEPETTAKPAAAGLARVISMAPYQAGGGEKDPPATGQAGSDQVASGTPQ